VKLLIIPAAYPHAAAEWTGIFNEQSTLALQQIVQHVEVLSPRPYAPRFLTFNDRWKAHIVAPKSHLRRGIRIHRPAYPRVPGILRGFWSTTAAYVFSRRLATALHREIRFDAIVSFDLAGAGGLAWRLGRRLGIRSSGWATGSDIRWGPNSGVGRSVRKTLERLDFVFYQTSELKVLAAHLLGIDAAALSEQRHIVQARGVSEPSSLPLADVRSSVRERLGLSDHHLMILYIGRIAREKGLFDLADVFAKWGTRHPDLAVIFVGARPGHDETDLLRRRVDSLGGRIRILPGCPHDEVWNYLSAADIFVFPSFKEGMPNSLLEAMLARLPSVAFGIPCVQEIVTFGNGLLSVAPYDFEQFGDAILTLAANESLRREIGERGRAIASEHFSLQRSMRTVVAHLATKSKPEAVTL